MGRTERPEQVQAPALRSIIRMIDMAIENGSLDASDRDEVIKMFISGPTTVVDNKAGGGMINIDEMTRPLGYKEGKEVGVRERIYNWLAPNEKMSDEELRLQGINPDSVLPEERPQAEGRPEGVLQGIFGELFGGRGAEGSTLVDFLKSKRARLMSDIQGEMQGNIFGTGVDEGKIKILQIEIDKLTEQLNDLGEK